MIHAAAANMAMPMAISKFMKPNKKRALKTAKPGVAKGDGTCSGKKNAEGEHDASGGERRKDVHHARQNQVNSDIWNDSPVGDKHLTQHGVAVAESQEITTSKMVGVVEQRRDRSSQDGNKKSSEHED